MFERYGKISIAAVAIAFTWLGHSALIENQMSDARKWRKHVSFQKACINDLGNGITFNVCEYRSEQQIKDIMGPLKPCFDLIGSGNLNEDDLAIKCSHMKKAS